MTTPIDPDDFLDELDRELSSSRTGNCSTCDNIPEEYRRTIQLKLNEGKRAWTVYVRTLARHGIVTTKAKLSAHYDSSHDRDLV